MTTRRKSLAVLIDADNSSHSYAKAIFEEVAALGEASVRRIYGDFSGERLKGWNDATENLAILQTQARTNTTGKNASDIALVIDAMDLMYRGHLDGFCIVSSDSDFTRLAQRLREQGAEVIGFGERKTPQAFVNACNRFIYLENLSLQNGNAETHPSDFKLPAREAVHLIQKALEGFDENDGWVNLSAVGNLIRGVKPDFDCRSYGCSKLSVLVDRTGQFETKGGNGKPILIRRKQPTSKSG